MINDHVYNICNTKEGLQNAWLLRWNQQIDESMMALAKIQVQEKWEMLSIDQLPLLPRGPHRENYLEALLLKSAFLRAQGQEQKSSALLRKILNKNIELADVPSFRLLFELGIDCWRREDIAGAMDYFFLAEKKASNSIEKIFTLSNILWCLEALDLNRSLVHRKVIDLVLEIEDRKETKSIRNVLEQLDAYETRTLFYQSMSIKAEEKGGQSHFLKKWMENLPYMNIESEKEISPPKNYFWQSSYRQRTLIGLFSPIDRSVIKAGDAIDRLYLWVWKWMASEEISTEKIIWTLESILQQLDIEAQSKENLLLLRNACAWISFLEPQLETKLEKALGCLQKISSSHYPLLETEFLLIQCLSQNNSSDLISSLASFPVFEKIFQKQINFFRIEKRREILEIINSKNQKGYSVQVDFSCRKITLLKTNQNITSFNMTRLIQLIEENERVPFNLININGDTRAIYNLATRLKKIFPKNAFYIEQQEFFKGSNWPKILITKNIHDVDIHEFPLSETYTGQKQNIVGSETYFQAARSILPSTFNRQQLEGHLRVSKATACRMLEEWLKQERIIKTGKARNITYTWKVKI